MDEGHAQRQCRINAARLLATQPANARRTKIADRGSQRSMHLHTPRPQIAHKRVQNDLKVIAADLRPSLARLPISTRSPFAITGIRRSSSSTGTKRLITVRSHWPASSASRSTKDHPRATIDDDAVQLRSNSSHSWVTCSGRPSDG